MCGWKTTSALSDLWPCWHVIVLGFVVESVPICNQMFSNHFFIFLTQALHQLVCGFYTAFCCCFSCSVSVRYRCTNKSHLEKNSPAGSFASIMASPSRDLSIIHGVLLTTTLSCITGLDTHLISISCLMPRWQHFTMISATQNTRMVWQHIKIINHFIDPILVAAARRTDRQIRLRGGFLNYATHATQLESWNHVLVSRKQRKVWPITWRRFTW